MNNVSLRNVLSLLAKYDANGYIAAEHDVIYIGGLDPDSMHGVDVDELEKCGAWWDEHVEAWRVFV